MNTAIVQALATCPVHGAQVFRRVGECNWWECPETGMLEPRTCGSVIPDESVTPDGAEVVHWSDAQRSRYGQPRDTI
jgi:hypothetical protein